MHEIHPQLLADCHVLGHWPESTLLLNRNSLLHWLILVPHRTESDLLDVPQQQRELILNRAARVSEILKEKFQYPKVNFAALGNVVPQLHLHLVGRRPGDACWPRPVWGNLPEGADYSSEELLQIQQLMFECDA